MQISKNQSDFLTETIQGWEASGTITPALAETLRDSYTVRKFDWKKLAKYAFWVASACAVIGFASLVADQVFLAFLERLFIQSDLGVGLFLGVMAAVAYTLGWRHRRRWPEKAFSNEAIMLLGVMLTAGAIGYLGQHFDNGSGHFSLLLLLATAVYAALGWWLRAKLIWVFALLSLGGWFGAESGYVSGWGAYFLGMNYPLRFVLFGAVLTGLGVWAKGVPKAAPLQKPTYVLGLLYLFIALWILSIFGNYGDMDAWYDVSQLSLLHWGLLFGAVAVGSIVYGLRYDDYTARSFGVVFLFINLYTKYFEYFWDATHKGLFFLVLAISFWLVGRKAETIWRLEFLKTDKDRAPLQD